MSLISGVIAFFTGPNPIAFGMLALPLLAALILAILGLLGFTSALTLFLRRASTRAPVLARWSGIIAAAIVFALVLTVWLALGARTSVDEQPLAFDPRAWAERPDDRWRMAQDVVDRELLLGKSSEQVNAVLGQPETSAPSEVESTTIATWNLAGEDDYEPIYQLLVIYDEQGRAVGVDIERD